MSIRTRLFRAVIAWLWARHQYLVLDIVLGPDRHIHRNPRKRPRVVAIETYQIKGE